MFANAAGGTILVGAVEGKAHDLLGRYQAFPEEEAGAFKREVEDSIRSLCRPPPRVDVIPLVVDAGFVVAINVHPYPGQLVGVQVKAAATSSQGYAGDAFVFPRRVGSQCEYIPADIVPMFVDARTRRIAILLGGVPLGTTLRVHYVEPHRSTPTYLFRGLDELRNAVTLGQPGQKDVTLPIEGVESVWQAGEQWHVAINQRWMAMSNE